MNNDAQFGSRADLFFFDPALAIGAATHFMPLRRGTGLDRNCEVSMVSDTGKIALDFVRNAHGDR